MKQRTPLQGRWTSDPHSYPPPGREQSIASPRGLDLRPGFDPTPGTHSYPTLGVSDPICARTLHHSTPTPISRRVWGRVDIERGSGRWGRRCTHDDEARGAPYRSGGGVVEGGGIPLSTSGLRFVFHVERPWTLVRSLQTGTRGSGAVQHGLGSRGYRLASDVPDRGRQGSCQGTY